MRTNNHRSDSRLPGQGRVRQVTPELLERARQLRQQMTPTEVLLWDVLRDNQVGDCRFRRQHPVGTFVLDFYCPAARLAVEVDGSIHDREGAKETDAARQEEIEAFGVRVLRFRNEQVTENREAVVEIIRVALLGRRRPPRL